MNSVVWVTSAYMLAYAVPVLITGRLGDRYGPKNLYLLGLTVFTLASLWCGLTGDHRDADRRPRLPGPGRRDDHAADDGDHHPDLPGRATRHRRWRCGARPPEWRWWSARSWVACSSTALGWEWIFFINVPVGMLGFVLAWRLVPALPTHAHRFDWLGVALSGVGLFLLVFGIQEGHQYDWGTITGSSR